MTQPLSCRSDTIHPLQVPAGCSFADLIERMTVEAQNDEEFVLNSIGILVLIMIFGRVALHSWLIFRSVGDKSTRKEKKITIPKDAREMFPSEIKEALEVAYSDEHTILEGVIIVPR
jgi:hypothetical protein